MAEVRKVRRKKREKRLGFNWFFWLGVLLIAVPCCLFVWLLSQASKESNTPILGTRVQDTVVYEIHDEQVAEVTSAINGIEGVKKSEVNLIVQTLRISLEVDGSYTAEQVEELLNGIYEKVNEVLPVETYFTRENEIKEYDLEITAYNNLTTENPIIMVLAKNAAMEEYSIQNLSSPLNADLAYDLTHTEDEQSYEDIGSDEAPTEGASEDIQ